MDQWCADINVQSTASRPPRILGLWVGVYIIRPNMLWYKTLQIIMARPRAIGQQIRDRACFFSFLFLYRRVTGCLFFHTATRSGFERCNKNPNPIINPIFYPIFYPIATRLPQIFICFQLKFHIPDPFQLILALDNTKRVLFCANPEVDFEFLEYLTFWDTFDGSAIALSFQ